MKQRFSITVVKNNIYQRGMTKLTMLVIIIVVCNSFFTPRIGDVIDSLNGVKVYYNGSNFAKSYGRNLAPDGYNLGLKYQCVEFVKRYYYQVYKHKMPNTQGNAREFLTKTRRQSFQCKAGANAIPQC